MNCLALIVLVLIACSWAEDQSSQSLETTTDKTRRAGRNFDYYDPDSFNSDGDHPDNSLDIKDDDEDNALPPRGEDRYSFPNKDYGPPKGYNPKPLVNVPNYGGYKGLPYGYSNWKGIPPAALDHKEMAMMVDLMHKLNAPKKEEKGLLSKLMDSKPVLIASIIPLSIIIFSVAPVVIKYFQNSTVPNMVTSIASSKWDGLDGQGIPGKHCRESGGFYSKGVER
ncbi:uncharacterized protein CEXT_47551 [Caerostris extrusa]|uniref:Uncharacterized protein n=1 Tax=Caerostris extrusa TaxID=172846 RepID=A0AAV4TZL0_CAEEX|nr:uncharacterized protein CEXT_47551 [Caerostris extrusa]